MGWFKVLQKPEEHLPVGKQMLIRAGNLHICLVNDFKLGFRAVQNECSHRGANLHEGWINGGGEIICPLHDYRFSLLNGEEMSNKHCPSLKCYALKRDHTGALYIELPFEK